MQTDRELIIQLQKGDLAALGDLFDRHQRLVFRTAVGITGDEQVASDLLQDVFLRMHRFSRHIDPDRPLEPWLYRTTANLTYTWMKRHKRWLRPLEDVAEWLAGSKKQVPDHIAEIDALISLSNLASNNPEFDFPEMQEHEFTFQAKNLGHPLLKANKRIRVTVHLFMA